MAIALTGACEARLGGDTPATDDAAGDGSLFSTDGPEPDAPLGDFGPPQLIAVAATTAQEDDGSLSHDGLELIFARVSNGQKDLFYTSRPDLQSAFGTPTLLPFSAAGTSEETPRFSDDDLTLYFAKTVGTGNLDIHRVTRPNAGSQLWGTPTLVQGVNSAGVDKWFMPCGTDGRFLIIIGADIGEGVQGQGAPTVVAELSSVDSETGPFVTKDCLNVTFASTRGGGVNRLYTSSRAAVTDPWSAPVLLDIATIVGVGGDQQDPFISDDTRTFLFVSNNAGTNDLYLTTR